MPHRANGSYVSNADALTAWTPIAFETLLETARTYHAVLTGDELAATVQQLSGIVHDQPASTWIGKLLDRVALEAQRRDEPPLAALCVHDGDDELRAGRRLLCYRQYAVDLPADGGVSYVRVVRPAARTASRPRSVATPRVKAPAPSLREVTCPNCWMIVAARPTCASCGAPLE